MNRQTNVAAGGALTEVSKIATTEVSMSHLKTAMSLTHGDKDRNPLVNCAPAGAVRAAHLTGLEDVSGPALAAEDYVEAIVDGDFETIDQEHPLVMHLLPSTTPILVFQYRTRIGSIRHFGAEAARCPHHGAAGTVLKSGIITIVSNGSTGMVLVRLKPEMAALVLGEQIDAFANTEVDVAALFGHQAVSLLEEQLNDASTSNQRIQLVLDFLRARTRLRAPDPVVNIAAQRIRRSPTTRIRSLAVELQISERQLSRRFLKVVGSTPKQFSRLARFERLMAARSVGESWADVSYSCGFNDQAHMINDVGIILGDSPEKAISALGAQREDLQSELGQQPILVW